MPTNYSKAPTSIQSAVPQAWIHRIRFFFFSGVISLNPRGTAGLGPSRIRLRPRPPQEKWVIGLDLGSGKHRGDRRSIFLIPPSLIAPPPNDVVFGSGEWAAHRGGRRAGAVAGPGPVEVTGGDPEGPQRVPQVRLGGGEIPRPMVQSRVPSRLYQCPRVETPHKQFSSQWFQRLSPSPSNPSPLCWVV